MVKTEISKLEGFLNGLLKAVGMNSENTVIMTDIFMRTTLRGVGHHDIYDLSGRIRNMSSGKTKANPVFNRTAAFEAMESYDGDNGPGELCCSFITNRAMELAEKHGIGFCTIKNSNHFLAAAPYVEMAAEKGYLALIFSRTPPGMGITKKVIGNGPMGFGAPTNEEFPIMLDICLAYASYGKLEAMRKANEKVPSHWGRDKNGLPTDDPAAITSGGVPAPVSEHKGLGLAMLIEILTGVLAGGVIIDEENPAYEKGTGEYSQSVLAFKADGLISSEQFKAKTTEMIDRMKKLDPEMHVPGKNSYNSKKKLEEQGYIMLKEELVNTLNDLAGKLGAELLKN